MQLRRRTAHRARGSATEREFGVQWWQPLAPGRRGMSRRRWIMARRAPTVFSEGRAHARASASAQRATLALGRELANWGDLQVGVTRQRAGARAVIPGRPGAVRAATTTPPTSAPSRSTRSIRSPFPPAAYLFEAPHGAHRCDSRPRPAAQARTVADRPAAFRRGNWAGHVYGEWALVAAGSRRFPGRLPAPVRHWPDSLEGRRWRSRASSWRAGSARCRHPSAAPCGWVFAGLGRRLPVRPGRRTPDRSRPAASSSRPTRRFGPASISRRCHPQGRQDALYPVPWPGLVIRRVRAAQRGEGPRTRRSGTPPAVKKPSRWSALQAAVVVVHARQFPCQLLDLQHPALAALGSDTRAGSPSAGFRPGHRSGR